MHIKVEIMDEEDALLICRRSLRKRRFPSTPSKSSKSQGRSRENSKQDDHSCAQDKAALNDGAGDFSSLNESDLLLASISDAELMLATNKVDSTGASISMKCSTPCDILNSKAYLQNHVDTHLSDAFDPEQDLFDESDFHNSQDMMCQNGSEKDITVSEETALNDSLSEYFFRHPGKLSDDGVNKDAITAKQPSHEMSLKDKDPNVYPEAAKQYVKQSVSLKDINHTSSLKDKNTLVKDETKIISPSNKIDSPNSDTKQCVKQSVPLKNISCTSLSLKKDSSNSMEKEQVSPSNTVAQSHNSNRITQNHNSNTVAQSHNSNRITQNYNSNTLAQSHNSNRITQSHNSNRITQNHNSNRITQNHNSNTVAQSHNSNVLWNQSVPQKVATCISTPTNPTVKSSTRGSSLLKDKLKKRLQSNTSVVSCQKKFEEEIKNEAIAQAKIDASQIRKEGTSVDIGPFFGLPEKVQRLLGTARGISKLYDWQVECLQLDALKNRNNLIYSLPTSGGKTLVAEILIMRELLCYKRDALLVLPFVSIVQEKVRSIAEFATELGFIVEEYAGSKGRFPPMKRREKKSLYIATIEKAHSLVNSLIENDRISALGLIVVDELHMIGEGGSRGANLESLLLKTVISKSETQIIGMSATLNNIGDLQAFLHAEVYSNDFRPVSLKEFVKVEDNVFSINNKALSAEDKLEHEKIVTFPYAAEIAKQDPDHLLGLVMEVIPDNSCLVFCSSKKNCENVSLMLSRMMSKQHRNLTTVKRDKRKQLLRELSQDGQGNICPVLEFTVHYGLAYHHSGLTMDERRLLEDAYSDGTLCLLACTSTLAAGVNLPAKRVILRSPYVGMNLIKYSQYKQMVGRAGRAGIDTSGESYLIVKQQDRMKVKDLLAGPKDVCHSSLAYEDGKGVRTLVLSAIGLKLVTSIEAALDLTRQSLLNIQSEVLGVDIAAITRDSVQYLLDQGLVVYSQPAGVSVDEGNCCALEVTPIGRATFKGSVDHAHSSQLYKDLKSAETSLNLATYLHLLFLVTPYDAASNVTPSWDIYFKKFCNLSELEVKVASLVGVPENYLGLRAAGRSSKKKICVLTVNRFYLTLMLWDLWNEKSVWEVADTFSQTRGFVQNLLSQAAAFASCVLHFCQELEEFWAYQQLLGSFVKRLAHCVTIELLPLMEVTGVKMARAKQLYAAGYRTVASLAGAVESDLVKNIEYMSRHAARQIISAAKNILEEKTAALMEEVDLLKA